MKTTYYADSIGVVAIITLIVASILTPALLFTQTAIASIDDEQSGNTITNDTEMTPQAATASDSATTQRVAVGGGNITFSVNQFIPQITEIQPGENVTFFAPDGSIELHNVIFDLSNGTIISEKWLPFTLPSDFLGGEVPTDVSEELLLAPPYNLGEPIIQNTTTNGATQAIIGLNKVAWQPAVIDHNDNVIYLEEQELSEQMRQVQEAFEGTSTPLPLSASYTLDGTEILVSSGIVLDINGFATLEELFSEEGGGTQQEQLAAEDNQSTMTNSITTTTTPSPSLSQEEEATMAQQEEQVGEIPPTPFPFLDSFTLTFNEPGTYDYFCAFHPGMFGQVIVGGSGGGEERQTNQTSTTI